MKNPLTYTLFVKYNYTGLDCLLGLNLEDIYTEKKNCNRCHGSLMDEAICGARANEKLQSTHTIEVL